MKTFTRALVVIIVVACGANGTSTDPVILPDNTRLRNLAERFCKKLDPLLTDVTAFCVSDGSECHVICFADDSIDVSVAPLPIHVRCDNDGCEVNKVDLQH